MTERKKDGREPHLWLPLSLLKSPAWQKRSINCRRLLDFLAIEDVRSAGRNNGQLHATYKQLKEFGIPARKITEAISEAEALGLIEVEHGKRIGPVSRMSSYRLTYTQTYKDGKAKPPTHDWRQFGKEDVHRVAQERREKREKKKIQKTQVTSDVVWHSPRTSNRYH